MRRPNGPVCAGTSLVLALAFGAPSIEAQTAPTPDQRRQASASYDQAVAARASGNHAAAASLFETANRLAPSPQALGNAIRSHRDAHAPQHDARAATLSLRLIALYPTDTRAVGYAQNVVQELAHSLSHVTIQCDHCEVEVDHANSPDTDFYLEPGPHTIIGYWGTRTRTHAFTATSGGTETIALATPPPDATTTNTAVATNASPAPDRTNPNHSSESPVVIQPPPARGGLPPAVAITGIVLTVGLGATLGWSLADMYGGVPAYETAARAGDPAASQLLMDGQGREVRTDVLIAATAVVGAATIGTLIFTRWSAAPRVEAIPVVASSTGTAPGLTLAGTF